VRVVDLRPWICTDLASYGIASKMVPGPGDPNGARIVDLGDDSFFRGVPTWLLRGVFTERGPTRRAHAHGHRYALSGTMCDSDVFLSVPKLKTHHKVGVTLNIKGLVGTVQDKNHLPHWRIGFPALGGDEFPNLSRRDQLLVAVRHALTELLPERVFHAAKQRTAGTRLELILHETRLTSGSHARGAWPGNDTCWRMAADLYQAFVHRRSTRARFLSIIDGITGGEGDGPFCPKPRASRVVLAGNDLLATDVVAVELMGLRREGVRYLPALLRRLDVPAGDIRVMRDGCRDNGFLVKPGTRLDFEPPSTWPDLRRTVV